LLEEAFNFLPNDEGRRTQDNRKHYRPAMSRSYQSSCSPRSTVDSAKVREWMHALPWSPQWDWLREQMAAAIGEPPPDVPEMPNPMAELLGILGDGENVQGDSQIPAKKL